MSDVWKCLVTCTLAMLCEADVVGICVLVNPGSDQILVTYDLDLENS